MIHSFYVFGANTDVGKTVFSGLLMRAACQSGEVAHYLKPVQTGFPHSDDGQWVKQFSGAPSCQTFITFPEPISPHRCGQAGSAWISDARLISQCAEWLQSKNTSQSPAREIPPALALIEGAGGVLSPSPSGKLAADVYRALRLPVILVGDSRLGGISSTLAAYESLRMRGYEIALLALFRGEHENAAFLRQALGDRQINCSVLELSFSLQEFHMIHDDQIQSTWQIETLNCLQQLRAFYTRRTRRIAEIETVAKRHFWWPFTQHAITSNVKVIDSAMGGSIVTARVEQDELKTDVLFDGSASWWTLGVGHGEPRTAAAVGAALGRYGHVLFPEQAHEPAAQLAETLIAELGGGNATRVFYSDNGSTAVEVGLKMAFRLASTRGVLAADVSPRVIGLLDSYHGDTLGAVSASSPNIFKNSDRWYVPRGRWLDFPRVAIINGKWTLLGFQYGNGSENAAGDDRGKSVSREFDREFENLDAIFDIATRVRLEPRTLAAYKEVILCVLADNQVRDIGAVLLEPVLHGSAGMIFVDPLFHYAVVTCAQDLFIPVVFDEVFSGIWRLGSPTAARLLGVKPDISCFSKTLTGGALPLSVTLATEETFNAFSGDSKATALLHGHSYTAHPAGCAAACESFGIYTELKNRKNPMSGYWDGATVQELSQLPLFTRTIALGTVLAFELKADTSGYASQASRSLASRLAAAGIQIRPLGNVVYLMTHPMARKEECDDILQKFKIVANQMK
jgi:dethiobiotin synthetase/adenosylmethionine--8-amino-7-oxononanoate aminotransferase